MKQIEISLPFQTTSLFFFLPYLFVPMLSIPKFSPVLFTLSFSKQFHYLSLHISPFPHFTFPMSLSDWHEDPRHNQDPTFYYLLHNIRPYLHLVTHPLTSEIEQTLPDGDYLLFSISDSLALRLHDGQHPFAPTISEIAPLYGSLPSPVYPEVLSQIHSFTIPKTITLINDGSFCGLPHLVRVDFEIDPVLTYVGGFCHCPRLAMVVLPSTIKEIGPQGFSDCKGLLEVQFSGRTKTLSEWKRKYKSPSKGPRQDPKDFKPIASSLETISGFNRSVIEQLKIPNSVTMIDGCNGEADVEHQVCIGIHSVVFDKESQLIHISGFSPPALRSIRIPAKVKVIEETAFVGDISGEERASHLEEIVFEDRSELEKVLGVRNCPRLNEVTLPMSVTEIGKCAFLKCGQDEIQVNVLAARRAVVVLDIEDAWVNSKRKIRFV
jgi:hypothetical protein